MDEASPLPYTIKKVKPKHCSMAAVFVFLIILLIVCAIKMGCGVIVSLRFGLQDFWWDFDTAAPPHDHYCVDSNSK